jgi:hypothetical protein
LFGKLINSWNEEDIFRLQSDIISSFLEKDTPQSTETSVEFAKFLNYRQLDDRSYPIFLELLLHKNVDVIDALISDGAPLYSFKKLQRSKVLVKAVFDMLEKLSINSYQKALEALLGVLYLNYRQPIKGWELYEPTIENLNYVGKYLDKNKPQSDKINRIVLDILGDIGELSSQETEDKEIDRIGAHANKIRNVYFDNRDQMDKVIPSVLRI